MKHWIGYPQKPIGLRLSELTEIIMKKIVHLTSVHPAQDIRIFHKECKSLKELGYHVTLIAQAEKDSVQDGIQIIAVKKTTSRLRRMTLLLWDIYRKATNENADLYHFHDPELIPIGLLLRLHRKKVIYDIHEDVPRDILLKDWVFPFFRPILAKLFEVFENFSAKFFHGLVTVTPFISKRFPPSVTAEVRNYPILDAFSMVSKSDEPTYIFYSGLISHKRGMLQMLEVAQLSETELYLAGRFDCEHLSRKITGADLVTFLGYLNREQLTEAYAKSIVGLALLHPGPTFNNSLPIKLFEYMAAGIPVIVSDFPLWRDIIDTHGCGFCVDPFDTQLISQKIAYLKQHPKEATEMGARGKYAIAKYYHWQLEFTKLAELYERILN